jgi:hypothetical protein
MTLQVVTIAVNLVTIAMLIGIITTSARTYMNMRKQSKMIESYRHDIAWLMARQDDIEAKLEAKARELEAKLRNAE